MGIRLTPGAYGTGVSVIGGGLVGAYPDHRWVGWIFVAIGVLIVLWGITIDGDKWWRKLRPGGESTQPMIPFRNAVRRLALHSEWGLSYAIPKESWRTWQEDLKREVLHRLTESPPRAHGIRTAAGEPEDSAPTLIPPDFWAKADFKPEHMLVDNQTGMVWQKGDPCPLLYMDVAITRDDVDRLWPALSNRRRAGRVSAFAALAREWHDQQEDVRVNSNPGVGFDVEWNRLAKLDSLSQAAADRAAYEMRKLTGGIGDPVAFGARLLEKDKREPRVSPAPPLVPKSRRDTTLSEALAYAALGRWGEKFSKVPLHLADWESVRPPMDQFREAALRGDLMVWGKPAALSIFEQIPHTYWREHSLDVQSLMMGRAVTSPLAEMEATALFEDLMVNRSEVERTWPHAG